VKTRSSFDRAGRQAVVDLGFVLRAAFARSARRAASLSTGQSSHPSKAALDRASESLTNRKEVES
jgi:hypothetical protein